MPVKITSEDTKDCKVAIFEPIQDGEPTIYDLAFLHIELRWIREYNLDELELLVFGFINSYRPSSGKIYFSNMQLGKMFNKSERTISRTISTLHEKKLIDVELQTNAVGGTIRFLRPKADTTNLSRGVDKIGVGGRQNWLPNSNRNSNKNNIYISFIESFNSLVGAKYKGDSKSERSFEARMKEGYALEDFIKAVTNAKGDKFLMGDNDGGKKYLTPEYISRSDKLAFWLNQGSKDVRTGYK